MLKYFDFEKNIEDLDNKIHQLNLKNENSDKSLLEKYMNEKENIIKQGDMPSLLAEFEKHLESFRSLKLWIL